MGGWVDDASRASPTDVAGLLTVQRDRRSPLIGRPTADWGGSVETGHIVYEPAINT